MTSRIVGVMAWLTAILGRASLALAGAGGAPWDTQMNTIWLSITGGPFAALVLGTGHHRHRHGADGESSTARCGGGCRSPRSAGP